MRAQPARPALSDRVPATRIDSASSLTAGSWLRESGPKIKWLPSTPAGPADFRIRPAGRPAAQAKRFGSFCCACAAAAASTAVLASSGGRDAVAGNQGWGVLGADGRKLYREKAGKMYAETSFPGSQNSGALPRAGQMARVRSVAPRRDRVADSESRSSCCRRLEAPDCESH